MDDLNELQEYIKDQYDTLTEDNVSREKLIEIHNFIIAYGEDNYLI